MALSNVDLPAFGAPMMVTKPARNDVVSIGAITLQQLIIRSHLNDITYLQATASHDMLGADQPRPSGYDAVLQWQTLASLALLPAHQPLVLSGNPPGPRPGARAPPSDHSVRAIPGLV
jgi:hypothetical protein